MRRRVELWKQFLGWAFSVPVRVKIMGIVLAVTFLLAIVVTIQIRQTLRKTLREELRRRGIAVARDVAGRAAELILTDNLFAVHELVKSRLEHDHEVRYILVIDRSQDLVAHTFGDSLPSELLQANSAGLGEEFAIAALDTEEGLVWDVAAPILDGKVGTVRVGMSERNLQAVVADTTHFLLLVTACVSLVGIVTAYLLTFVLTQPILALVEVTEAIRGGDLRHKAPVRTRDEIGRLGMAFNVMTEDLARSRNEIEQSNRQLLRRNEELSVLNNIASTLSHSLNLVDVLNGALAKVLEAVNVKAGWVFLRNGSHEGYLTLAASKGISNGDLREEMERELGDCVCREVMDLGEARVIEDLQLCPRLSREVLQREGLSRHVSVPLKAKNRVLGIMNLACGVEQRFGEHELRLLTSIGHQIGIAIENASLYEEVQGKEESRRRLLDKLIHAQEDERKRVARELHDQVGQSLTALMMGLGSIEELISPDSDQVKRQLDEVRSLTAGILEEIRRLMMDLRPALLDDLGLIPAVRSYSETQLARAGVAVQVHVVGVKRKLPSTVDIALFRVVQEGITNIVKHAGARQATIQLEFRESSVVATIEDDGRGFDDTQLGRDARALGLLGMHERVALSGGSWQIESQPGYGTRIEVEIPTRLG